MAKHTQTLLGKLWQSLGLDDAQRDRARRKQRTARPEVELLEDRTVPAVFGTVRGNVFLDRLANGILDARDARIPGVSVTLTGTTAGATGNTSIKVTAVTNANGSFTFTSVPQGNYKLKTGVIPGVIGGAAKTFSAITIATDGQVFKHDFAFTGGVAARSFSMRQFLTNSTPMSFPYAKPGAGTAIANHAPTVSSPIPAVSTTVAAANTVVDLAGHFKDADFTNSQLTFNITNGAVPAKIKMTLFDTQTPQTVTNFFDYVTGGQYDNSIFHRLTTVVPNGLGVLQGGSLKLANPGGTDLIDVPVVPTGSTVPNEFLAANSNVPGTIAMAQAGNPNSATNQFFFNTTNNAASLDGQRFAVFGKVADAASQTVLNTLAQTSTQDLSGTAFAAAHPTALLNNLPLTGYAGPTSGFPGNATVNNYMTINSITIDKRDEFLTYSLVGANGGADAAVATVTITNEYVTISPNTTAGITTATVQATDRYGATATTTIKVTVS